ncbi:MAG: hypothetical protein J0M12_13600 [Deltaproteobacteria bacterium]|nr:hypothetical protein [Deltaproteobacteria bacterium]
MVKTKVLNLLLTVFSLVLGNESMDQAPQAERKDTSILPLRLHTIQPYKEESYFHYLPQ